MKYNTTTFIGNSVEMKLNTLTNAMWKDNILKYYETEILKGEIVKDGEITIYRFETTKEKALHLKNALVSVILPSN